MKCLIKLKPLDKFFFGREQTFEQDNYFAKSSYLPQQTQILGMLRKEILIQNNFLTQKRRGEWVDKPKADEAKKYVGYERFKIDADYEQDLGVIKNISPIFLLDKEDNIYYFSAKEHNIRLISVENGIPEIRFKKDNKLYTEKGSKNYLQKIISQNCEYNLNDIFIDDTQVGISKSRTGGTDDNAFFKKRSYKLDKKFSFAFILELNDKLDTRLNNSIVTLGGERSLFKMQVLPENILCKNYESKISNLYKKESLNKLILLSDTFIKKDNQTIFQETDFAITDSTAFRTIDSKVTKWKSKKTDIKKYYFKKSNIYNLFEKGSVFYAPTKVLEDLISNKNLQNIGYNKYIIKGENDA